MKVKFFSIGGSLDINWVRTQALELCNLAGVTMNELIAERRYDNVMSKKMFSKKEVSKKVFKDTLYSIDIPDNTTEHDAAVMKLIIMGWCTGYNSTRPSYMNT